MDNPHITWYILPDDCEATAHGEPYIQPADKMVSLCQHTHAEIKSRHL